MRKSKRQCSGSMGESGLRPRPILSHNVANLLLVALGERAAKLLAGIVEECFDDLLLRQSFFKTFAGERGCFLVTALPGNKVRNRFENSKEHSAKTDEKNGD